MNSLWDVYVFAYCDVDIAIMSLEKSESRDISNSNLR